MPQIGSEKNPVRLSNVGKVVINSNVYSGKAKQNYNDNYDRIFGGSNVRKKKNG